MPPTTYTMVAFMKRKPGMSQEDFFKYWEDVHGPLVKPWAERFGLTYKQVGFSACPLLPRPVLTPSGSQWREPAQRPRVRVPRTVRRLRHL